MGADCEPFPGRLSLFFLRTLPFGSAPRTIEGEGSSAEEEPGRTSEFLPPPPAAQGLCLFQSSSFSSITDSTMSLNIITVTLNMGESGETILLSTYCMLDSGQA